LEETNQFLLQFVSNQNLSFFFIFFFKDLEIKSLVIESYHMGAQELLYVIPFVAKILESCAKSKVNKNKSLC